MEEGATALRPTMFSVEVQGHDPQLDGRDRPVAADAHEDEPTRDHAALLREGRARIWRVQERTTLRLTVEESYRAQIHMEPSKEPIAITNYESCDGE
jgi:hypothetical protein